MVPRSLFNTEANAGMQCRLVKGDDNLAIRVTGWPGKGITGRCIGQLERTWFWRRPVGWRATFIENRSKGNSYYHCGDADAEECQDSSET